MDCDDCHERPARYHLRSVVNGQTVSDLHLCEVCAPRHGHVAGAAPADAAGVEQWLAGLLGSMGAEAGGPQAAAPGDVRQCPRCGQTLAEFHRTGLLGCPECYDAFAGPLQALIRRVHGKIRHDGKVPLRGGARVRQRRTLDALRSELQAAVAAEDFERAAAVRDRIRALQPAAAPDGGAGRTLG